MKTNRFTTLVTVAFSLATFSTAGCAEKEKTAEAPVPPAKAATAPAAVPGTTTTTTTTVQVTTPPAKTTAPVPGPITTVQVVTTPSPDAASANWSDIKDCIYDTRAQFFAGLSRLEARVDEQMSELTAKRAAMPSTANTKDWDFTMKEMGNARSYLKAMGDELRKATPETWDQQKDKVGQAWVRAQDAYSKVKSSTTS